MPERSFPATGALAPRVPVARPELPRAEDIARYMTMLDDSRVYTNLGSMSLTLEARLKTHFGLTTGGATATASGWAAITGAILGRAGRARKDRQIALCASYTFVASVTAVQACGYRPYLVDVDAESWALDPQILRSHPQLPHAGLVLLTAPFGRLPDLAAWDAFTRQTGVPVVIDAAAGFDVASRRGMGLPSTLTLAMSFHATKAFGCGEGGAIFCTDDALLRRCHRTINNGFLNTRDVVGDNFNGKMSEYHACVALAELDRWAIKSARAEAVAALYRRQAARSGLAGRFFTGGAVSSAYALCAFARAEEALAARTSLEREGYDSRFWYGFGLHSERGFGPFPRDELPVTDRLARTLLGVPMFIDLPPADIARICTLLAGVNSPSSRAVT